MEDLKKIHTLLEKRGWRPESKNYYVQKFNPSYTTGLTINVSNDDKLTDKIKINLIIEEVYPNEILRRRSETRNNIYMLKRINEILDEIEKNDKLTNMISIEYRNWLLAKENNWDIEFSPGKSERLFKLGDHKFACFSKFDGFDNLHICLEHHNDKTTSIKYFKNDHVTTTKFPSIQELNNHLASVLSL